MASAYTSPKGLPDSVLSCAVTEAEDRIATAISAVINFNIVLNPVLSEVVQTNDVPHARKYYTSNFLDASHCTMAGSRWEKKALVAVSLAAILFMSTSDSSKSSTFRFSCIRRFPTFFAISSAQLRSSHLSIHYPHTV